MSGRSMRQRIATTALLFAGGFAVLGARAAQLTVLQGEALAQRATRQHQRAVSIAAQRGAIVDRNGEPLALSQESAAVYMRPRQWAGSAEAARTVARLLDLPPDVVLQRASAEARFVWLRRQVPLERWEAIEDLQLPGIGREPAHQRVYPNGSLAAQVLGFTNVDGHGLEGIERAFDAELGGAVEAMVVGHDARGQQFAVGEGWAEPPPAGAQVELTIDADLQRVAEIELERAVRERRAKAGTLVALDPRTGEVLALANVPLFDPNRAGTAGADERRNRAITDCYEPGSTFKAFLAAAALDAGAVRPDDRVFCENGKWAVGNRVIGDAHPHGTLSFSDVIAQSSNIGSAKVAQRLGTERFAAALDQFGFGRPTGIDLRGEVPGLVRPVAQWRGIHLATTAFGQGIAVTPLQITRAFAAIANGGRLMRPYVVRRITAADGTLRYAARPQEEARVISSETAKAVTEMLVRVTEAGTGKQARIEGIAVAGKTGTAQKVDPHTRRYSARDRMSSFIGYAPAEAPEVVILVVIDSPRTATYGGVVAAPVFRAVTEYALARSGSLTPRRVPEEGKQLAPVEPRLQLIEARLPLPEVAPAAPAEAMTPAVAPDALPSFMGLGMREALVRAQAEGWAVRVEGSGYVVRQDPQPGVVPPAGRGVTLYFGSTLS